MNYSMNQLGEYKFMSKCFLDKEDKNRPKNQESLHSGQTKNSFRGFRVWRIQCNR